VRTTAKITGTDRNDTGATELDGTDLPTRSSGSPATTR
jgi:hypothetical protein